MPGEKPQEMVSRAARVGFQEGMQASVSVIVGYLPAAVAFGVAAQGADLTLLESVFMSLIVYSGASQFAILGLAATGASWFVMAAISLILGVRHILYGPSLAPYLRRMSTGRAVSTAFGLTDEVFAVASVKLRERPVSFGWLLGLEAGAYASWALGTWIGAIAGTAVMSALPSLAPALSFALPALFVALLIALVRPEGAAPGGVPGPVAGAVLSAGAVAGLLCLAGLTSWSVPAGGVAGSIVGVLLKRGRAGAD